MKIKLDIECSPEEARKFLGLPDVAEFQAHFMKELHAKMDENIKSMDAETLMKTWLPMTMQGMGEMQKLFWQSMTMARPNTDDDPPKTSDGKDSKAHE